MTKLQKALTKIRSMNELDLATPLVQRIVSRFHYDNCANEVADVVSDYFITSNKSVLNSYVCKMSEYNIRLTRDDVSPFCIPEDVAEFILKTPKELEKCNKAINSKIRSFLNGNTDINDIGERYAEFEIDFMELDNFISAKIDFVDDIRTIINSPMTNAEVSEILYDIRDAESDKYVRTILHSIWDMPHERCIPEEAIRIIALAELYHERLSK